MLKAKESGGVQNPGSSWIPELLEAQAYCRRFCGGQSLSVQHRSTIFNKERVTGSISINCKPQISTDFYNVLNLVRDQGVGGSNPLSPTNLFKHINSISGFSSTGRVADICDRQVERAMACDRWD